MFIESIYHPRKPTTELERVIHHLSPGCVEYVQDTPDGPPTPNFRMDVIRAKHGPEMEQIVNRAAHRAFLAREEQERASAIRAFKAHRTAAGPTKLYRQRTTAGQARKPAPRRVTRSSTRAPPDPDGPRTPSPRTRYLAGQVHRLGPGPLSYLFHDLFSGKPAVKTVEDFATLAPLAPFIESLGGALAPKLFLVPEEEDR